MVRFTHPTKQQRTNERTPLFALGLRESGAYPPSLGRSICPLIRDYWVSRVDGRFTVVFMTERRGGVKTPSRLLRDTLD